MGQLLLLVAGALAVGAIGFGIAALLSGGDPGLAPVEPDGRAVPLPGGRPLSESDMSALRFDTGLRGYRMAQVDAALRRAAYDIGYKEELINVLEAEVSALRDGRMEDADTLRRARQDALRTSGPAGEPAGAAGSALGYASEPVDLAGGLMGRPEVPDHGRVDAPVDLADEWADAQAETGSQAGTGSQAEVDPQAGPSAHVEAAAQAGTVTHAGTNDQAGTSEPARTSDPAETNDKAVIAGDVGSARDNGSPGDTTRGFGSEPANATSEPADLAAPAAGEKTDKPAEEDDAVEWGAELDDSWGRQGTKLG
jgi:DivIVA domain-containing protein